jgi:hypothetical protein
VKQSDDPAPIALRLPLWLLMHPGVGEDRPENPFLTTRGPAGEIATPLFADADHAKRFREAEPQLSHFVLGAFEDPQKFLQLLDVFEQKGFTHVAMEPTFERSVFFTLAELRDAIRGS